MKYINTATVSRQSNLLSTIGELFSLPKTSIGLSQDMTKEIHRGLINRTFDDKFSGLVPSFPRPFSSNLINDQFRDIRYTKIPRILRSNDHFSMAFSKELRVPYLDRRIVEFCLSLPPELKIRGLIQKYLLRKAMAPHLPDALNRRWKVSFGSFQTDWFRRYFKKEIFQFLNSESFRSRPFWNHKEVEGRVGQFFEGKGDNSFFIWQMINLELWMRKFID